MTGHLLHPARVGAPTMLATLALGLALGLVSLTTVTGCGGPAHVESATGAATASPEVPASGFSENDKGWAKFHSKRFALSIPFPDGKGWKIDDHARSELVATHPSTRSTLVFATTPEPELMNRQKCEERARARGFVTEAEMRTVADEVTVGPEAYDTRVWVAIEPGKTEAAPIVGHLFAFGAFVRRCMFFHLTTEVAAAKDESVLASRLAAARLRILGGLTLDDFDAVPREKQEKSR